jgi:hypothetical protein
MNDLNMLFNNNTYNTLDKIVSSIKEYNEALTNKTLVMMNDIIPKNNDSLFNKIKENIHSFHHSINEDTNKLLSSTLNQNTLNDFIQNIDTKFSNSQQLITSIITSSEYRLDTKINDIKEISSSNFNNQSSLQNTIHTLLQKMENSSIKGKISENILFNILQTLFPSADIEIVGTQKETGDIMLRRKNKPTILIENKYYENRTIPQEQVVKFIRDIKTQNDIGNTCCGLFLSQNTGIVNKDNFEINIHNGSVLLYVHKVENDAEKIKMAIDIIDNFKQKLDENCSIQQGYTIDKEQLDSINEEYQKFASQKQLQIKTLRDFSTKMNKLIDDFQLPSLDSFLSKKYAFSSNSLFSCEYCDEFKGKNLQALSAHKRHCKFKPSEPSDDEIIKNDTIIEPISIEIETSSIIKQNNKKNRIKPTL